MKCTLSRIFAGLVLLLTLAATATAKTPITARDDCSDPLSITERQDLIRFLSRYDRDRAEDAVQDATISYLKTCREGKDVSNPAAWMHTVAVRRILNFKRKERNEVVAQERAAQFAPDESLLSDLISPEVLPTSRVLAERLNLLEILLLAEEYGVGRSKPEIAAMIDLPLTTIEYYGKMALKKVAALPEEHKPSVTSYSASEQRTHAAVVWIGAILVAASIALGVVFAADGLPFSEFNKAWREYSTGAQTRAFNGDNLKEYQKSEAAKAIAAAASKPRYMRGPPG